MMKKIIFSYLAVIFCFFSTPVLAQQLAIFTPILTTAPNFRDIAGISASNGGTGLVNITNNLGLMRPGVFYRSSALTVSGTDLGTISKLGLGRDIDLRTPAEIAASPDVVPAGAIYTNINVFGLPSLPSSTTMITSQASVLSAGQNGYRTFVTDPTLRAGFGTVLLTLAHDPGPDLYHCSDGKDRTGWTSVLLQSIAGVSPATIMNDYLASNTYLAKSINTQAAAVVAVAPGLNGMNFNQIFGVDPSYLQAALNQVAASYGSMDAYLIQGLGLTQADIYVLRAKMVYYPVLPGQTMFVGNAASGAAFLNALQNSPLSGQYTAYNYYLQSGVDAGNLGAVPARVGGQLHADAASYLLRQPLWIDQAIAPYTNGRDLGEGQARIWLAGLGGVFSSNGRTGYASSNEYNAGSLMGATYRISKQASADFGLGYNWGSVGSASATANINTVVATIGGRYAFQTLETGPFVGASAKAGWVDYQSNRDLGSGLGNTTGHTNGVVYGGLAELGYAWRSAPFTITPRAGVRFSGVNLDSFNETGGELALNIHGIGKTSTSLLAGLDVSLDRQQLGTWAISPDVTLGYERVLGNPKVESTGTLYGLAVGQESAYDSHGLVTAGLGLTAERGAFTVKARANALVGDGAKSAGIGGQISVGYNF